MSESQAIVVLMTSASSEEAARIAETLVAQKLAACVQILTEMQSVYVWKGEMQRDGEILIIAKSTRTNFEALERQVRAMHSYETPEIIALPIINGSKSYLEWLVESCDAS
jgi:periplasmic divalent cation tolerance protein